MSETDRRTSSVWRWQLALASCTVTIALAVAALVPELYTQWYVSVGFGMIVALTLVSLYVPWHRLPKSMIGLLPMLDIIVIGLLVMSANLRAPFLWVVPIAWIASYYTLGWLAVAMGIISSTLLVLGIADDGSPATVLRSMTTVLALAFLALTIYIGSQRTRTFSRLLRRRSEQLERTVERVEAHDRRSLELLDSLQVAIARIDRDGGLRFANEVYRHLYRLDELSPGLPPTAVEYDERRGDAVPAEAQLVARAARGELLSAHRAWLFDAEDGWRALDVTTQPLDDGTTVLQLRDVTGIVETESERAMLTRVVSHELRNPLTVVMGQVELLLERDDLPAAVRDRLMSIDKAGLRMERLVVSVLAQESAEEPEFEHADLGQIIEESIDAYRMAANRAPISLTSRLDAGLDVFGDPFRLRAALDNLIGNAVKYTPGGGAVRVTATAYSDHIEVMIADTGIGIEAPDLLHVFDPHFRARRALESGVAGTGLGMGIARQLIEDHGGMVDVNSAVDRGTTVSFTLPRHESEGMRR